MEWISLLPALAVCLILMTVPGLFVTLAVRMRGFDAVALAPAVSVGLIAVPAVLSPLVGIRWAVWVPFAAGIVVGAVFGLIGWGARALGIADFPTGGKNRSKASGRSRVGDNPRDTSSDTAALGGTSRWAKKSSWVGGELVPGCWFSREQLAYWISFVIAALVMVRTIKNSLGGPDRFSQTFDSSFHLNAVRYIAEERNGSSLFVSKMTAGGTDAGFYPAAWHDAVSLVFMTMSHGSVPVATNAMIVVVAAVVWPLSILYLMRSMMRFNLPSIMAAGAVLSGFAAFPVLLIYFGVLYPNFLGLALTPAGLGLIISILRVSAIRRASTIQALLLGIVAALGIAFAHPNAVMSLLIMTVPILVVRGSTQVYRAVTHRTRPRIAIVQLLLIAILLWVIWYLWGIIRPDPSAATWGPATSDTQAFGEALLNSPLSLTQAQWCLSALVMLGILSVLFTRHNVWLALVYVMLVYYYICVRWLQWDQGRMWVTGVWYNDHYRLAALLPVAAAPLAVIGVHWITQVLLSSTALERWRGRDPHVLRVVSVITVILCLGVTQFSHPLTDIVNKSHRSYYASEDAPLVNKDELNVIEHIHEYVPKNDTLMVNPWTGGSLAYALTGQTVSSYHLLESRTPQVDRIDKNLNHAPSDPGVCRDVNAIHAHYVLDFGTREMNDVNHASVYGGLQGLKQAGVARPVYQSGNAKLLKVTFCG